MDGQDYLNQISADTRPNKSSMNIFSSKLFWVGMGILILFIIIIIIGSILGNSKGSEKDLSFALKLHLDNTSEIIKKYQPEVKSSILRSDSASLYSVLSNTNSSLTQYITEKYDFKPKGIDKKIQDQATLEKDGLESAFFEAMINGNLDRIYAHKLAYEISMITTEESKIFDSTKNDSLREILTTSYNSLLNLYDKFNNFSETN